MTSPVVVKIGGSLLDWPELPERLTEYLAPLRGSSTVAIVGGGPIADVVREFDRDHGLGEERSHHLALRALDLSARLLADVAPVLRLVDSLAAFPSVWDLGLTPLLAPRRFLEEDDRVSSDPLPHSWRVTTDSIAARVAVRLEAAELVLLKSAPLVDAVDRDEAARRGLVDLAFPASSQAVALVTYRNFRDPLGPSTPLPRRLDGRRGDTRESESSRAAFTLTGMVV